MKTPIDLDLPLFDFARIYHRDPMLACAKLQLLLLDRSACQTRCEILRRESGDAASGKERDDYADVMRKILDTGIFAAAEEGNLGIDRLGSFARDPDALWSTHLALVATGMVFLRELIRSPFLKPESLPRRRRVRDCWAVAAAVVHNYYLGEHKKDLWLSAADVKDRCNVNLQDRAAYDTWRALRRVRVFRNSIKGQNRAARVEDVADKIESELARGRLVVLTVETTGKHTGEITRINRRGRHVWLSIREKGKDRRLRLCLLRRSGLCLRRSFRRIRNPQRVQAIDGVWNRRDGKNRPSAKSIAERIEQLLKTRDTIGITWEKTTGHTVVKIGIDRTVEEPRVYIRDELRGQNLPPNRLHRVMKMFQSGSKICLGRKSRVVRGIYRTKPPE